MQNAARRVSPPVAIASINDARIIVQTSAVAYQLLLCALDLSTPSGKNRFLVKGQTVEHTPILAPFYGSNITVDVPLGFSLVSADVTGDGNHPAVTLAFAGTLNGAPASYSVEVRFYNETRTRL